MIQVSRWWNTSRMAPSALRTWLRLFMVAAARTAVTMISGM